MKFAAAEHDESEDEKEDKVEEKEIQWKAAEDKEIVEDTKPTLRPLACATLDSSSQPTETQVTSTPQVEIEPSLIKTEPTTTQDGTVSMTFVESTEPSEPAIVAASEDVVNVKKETNDQPNIPSTSFCEKEKGEWKQ